MQARAEAGWTRAEGVRTVADLTCEVWVGLSAASLVGEARGTQRGRRRVGILSCEDSGEELGRGTFRPHQHPV